MIVLSEAQNGARRFPAAGRLSALEGGRPTWLVLPAVVVLLLVVVLVELLGAYIAFFSINLTNLSRWYQAPFAGVQNFVVALTDSSPAVTSAFHALLVSLKFTALSTWWQPRSGCLPPSPRITHSGVARSSARGSWSRM